MQLKGLKRLKTLCDLLGIKTFGELQDFYKQKALQGEAVVSTLERVLNSRK